MMQLPLGVILAGGQARRMGGGDKGLLGFGDRTLLSQVIDRLAPQVSGLMLNANGDASRFSAYPLPVVPDSVAGFAGPLAGILTGMDWAEKRGSSHIVTVAADTPFFPTDLVFALRHALADGKNMIALAATLHPERGMMRHPTFGLWPVALREDLRAALAGGVRKVVQWSDQHGVASVAFETPGEVPGFDPFFNINTPQDLELARAPAAKITKTKTKTVENP